jgi:hypothetical protein
MLNSQILNLIKIRLAVLELLHANRQIGRQDEANRYIFATSLFEEVRNWLICPLTVHVTSIALMLKKIFEKYTSFL